MAVESTTATRWDDLHQDGRHRLKYPSEHVVRFLAGLNLAKPSDEPYWGAALDIGCGSGRHLALLRDAGFFAYGVDSSWDAVAASSERGAAGGVQQAEMTCLPHIGGHFDVVIAYGVFYYGTMGQADQAVHEMHRVMRPGGHGFVCVRSCRDWRMDHLGRDGVFRLEGDPEDGMLLDFISNDEVEEVYGGLFSAVTYEIAECTTHERDRLNSDWLISVQK